MGLNVFTKKENRLKNIQIVNRMMVLHAVVVVVVVVAVVFSLFVIVFHSLSIACSILVTLLGCVPVIAHAHMGTHKEMPSTSMHTGNNLSV